MSVSDSAVLITSSDTTNPVFGTGFIIHQDEQEQASYLLTCAHVVRDVGGKEQVYAADKQAIVVAYGDPDGKGIDLAVLRVEGLTALPALTLHQEAIVGDAFIATGFQVFRPNFLLRPVNGVLGNQIELASRGEAQRVAAWDLLIKDDYTLQPGYSGSPVVREDTSTAIGVVSARIGEGQKGIAISVEGVNRIWTRNFALSTSPVSDVPSQASTSRKVFISYRSKDPDSILAQHLFEEIKAAGHQPFMAGKSIQWGENWPERISTELEACDYFLLLLSKDAATSEMVTEEVRRAKTLRTAQSGKKPVILTLRVGLPMDAPLNYDLTGYLNRTQQKLWNSPSDTPSVVKDLLSVLSNTFSSAAFPITQAVPAAADAVENNSRPLPIAPPKLPEGQVQLASKFYIERPSVDAECYEAISMEGSLIRIKAPRQMGKSSLMSRILQRASEQECHAVALTFQLADACIFTDLNLFLRWFCAIISRKLRLPNQLDSYWGSDIGSKGSCNIYFQEYILENITRPLALGLDEVDLLIQHPKIAADFFGLLRVWHEQAKNNEEEIWKKLRLVVVHSTEVYIPLNMNESPFNVGVPIELPEFTSEQTADLAERHGLRLTEVELLEMMNMIGGHPYLTRLALYALARQENTLRGLLQTAPTEAGLFGDHLRRHLWNLKQHPELASAMKRVVMEADPVSLADNQGFLLDSMGLVTLKDDTVSPRCELYRLYFRDRLRNLSLRNPQ